MTSLITNVLNHLSDAAVSTIFSGVVGYLCSRVVKQIDPRVGVACGAASGAVVGLFMANGSNLTSNIIAIAALFIIPFRVCQRRDLPVTPQVAAAISVTCAIITCLAAYMLSVAAAKIQAESDD